MPITHSFPNSIPELREIAESTTLASDVHGRPTLWTREAWAKSISPKQFRAVDTAFSVFCVHDLEGMCLVPSDVKISIIIVIGFIHEWLLCFARECNEQNNTTYWPN